MKADNEWVGVSYIVGGPEAGQPEFEPLRIYRGADGALWSKWKLSWRERFAVLFGKPIELGVLAERQPPVMMRVEP